MSISWPLAVASPVFLIRKYLYKRLDTLDQIKNKISINKIDVLEMSSNEQFSGRKPPIEILFLPAIIWLCVLFSRPHKEERFLYPIYPILALMAAYSMSVISQIFSDLFSDIITNNNIKKKDDHWSFVTMKLIFILCVIITSLLSCSRSVSNYSNFSGI
jgi:alpha-1,2-mannosyltransferase